MGDTLDTKQVIAEIVVGHHDDYLDELRKAVIDRVKETQLRARWKFELDGVVVTEDDLELGECAAIEQIAKVPWTLFRPEATAGQALALAQVCLHTRGGMTEAAAAERVKKLTAIEAADLFDIYLADPSPIDSPNPDPTDAPT